MAEYAFKCADGTDPNCWEEVEIELEVDDLSEEQLSEIEEAGGTSLSRSQIDNSGISLDEDQQNQLRESGFVYVTFELNNVCPPCGSDQDYDKNGENTTAL